MKIFDLVKTYDEFNLKIDKLDIGHGKIHGLIGPNGCGKSTLLKLMAGLLKPDLGNINYLGLTNRDITMIPRKPYFLHDTVYKNLIYPLKLRKINPDSSVIEFFLELAGLISKKNQYAPSLSGGEQQKLALVRAFIFKPKLILLDEAFSNLDIKSTSVFEEYILKRHQQEASTYVIISHQLSQIKRLCNSVVFMDEGKVEVSGSVEEVLEKAENESLKKYINFAT